MAISFDTSSYHSGSVTVSPGTWSHTLTGTFLMILVYGDSVSGQTTAVTFNGQSCTQLGTPQQITGGNYMSFWYFLDSTLSNQGAHTISVTFSGSSGHYLAAASYANVDSIEIPNSPHYSTTSSNAITTVNNFSWVVGMFGDTQSVQAGSGTTLRTNLGGLGFGIMDSGSAIAVAGSYTLNDAAVSSTAWLSIVASIKNLALSSTYSDTETESDSVLRGFPRTYTETETESDSMTDKSDRFVNHTTSKGSTTWTTTTKPV